MENIFEKAVEIMLPYIISVLEIMGILIVTWSALRAFYQYIRNTFFKKNYDMQYLFATGLATSLEFKMAAEILKTVLVREMRELIILGAIIVLRALVTILLKFEIRAAKSKKASPKPEMEKETAEKQPAFSQK